MKSVSILGATGSVGQSTIKVIKHHKEKFDVHVITGNKNVELLARQAADLNAKKAVVADHDSYAQLKELLHGTGIHVAAGHEALLEAACEKVDWTMASIAGMAGLLPLLKAVQRGGTIAIANKEPLVAFGPQLLEEAKKSKAVLLPVDSEHNAIFQVFEKNNAHNIRRLIITASGGPFRLSSIEDIQKATIEQALNHPNWQMGQKITIDSATLMNKALEIIEAHFLFSLPPENIEVLIHPQSVIHSMVEYVDGSILAQLGAPDMCTPITHALSWPQRFETPGRTLDLFNLKTLDFDIPDLNKFPSLTLAYKALASGQAACIALNAANEVAVLAFLEKQIGFSYIVQCVEEVMGLATPMPLNRLEDVLDYDFKVREITKDAILKYISRTKAA